MASTATMDRLTRVEVHEKFKRNFHAMNSKCSQPKANPDPEMLDDSLTNLHWLWNLNVSLSNGLDAGENNSLQHQYNNIIKKSRKPLPAIHQDSGLLPAIRLGKVSNPRTPHRISNKKSGTKTQQYFPLSNSSSITQPARRLTKTPSLNNYHNVDITNEKIKVKLSDLQPMAQHSLKRGDFQNQNPTTVIIPTFSSKEPVQSCTLNGHGYNSYRNLNLLEAKGILSGGKLTATTSKSGNTLPDADTLLRNYSFSPRQSALDVLPGQIDYKNNPYVKPKFSFTVLIAMALESSKRHKLSLPGICKWIKDNFIYYRYADPRWQNSIKANLTHSDYFSKVQKKREQSGKICMWQFDQNCTYQDMRDVESSSVIPANGLSRNFSPNAIPSIAQQSINATHDTNVNQDAVEFLQSLASRKRKQTTPQKVVRRREVKKRKEAAAAQLMDLQNKSLLQEEAPELGSLKGDFNWNSIFSDLLDGCELTATSIPSTTTSTTSPREEPVDQSTLFSSDAGPAALRAHDALVYTRAKSQVNDENLCQDNTFQETNLRENVNWSFPELDLQSPSLSDEFSRMEKHSENPENFLPDLGLDLMSGEGIETGAEGLESFLGTVSDLDLTVTGHQIEIPEQWVPIAAGLDDILCEKQDENLNTNDFQQNQSNGIMSLSDLGESMGLFERKSNDMYLPGNSAKNSPKSSGEFPITSSFGSWKGRK